MDLIKAELDSLFSRVPILGSVWKGIIDALINKNLKKPTSSLNDFQEKMKGFDLYTLKNLQKIVELRFAYKMQIITIGVLLLSIGISFLLSGYTLTPKLISISFYDKYIFYLIGTIIFIVGIVLCVVSFINFQICESIIETSEIEIERKIKENDEKCPR